MKALTFALLILMLQGCNEKKIVRSGLDRLKADNFEQFQGKNIGLICNHTSLDGEGNHIVDLFHAKTNVKAIFAPEHGYRGNEAAGATIEDGKDAKTGIDIYSLYGETRKPTPEMLDSIDVLVYDILDVGVRFYTYISTMTYCMEAAAEQGIDFVVLDRPNPIRGDIVAGPELEEEFKSFVGMHQTPVRYGLTAGEFATYINEEGLLEQGIKVNLQVVAAENWHRNQWYDETGLEWIAPSPNIPNLTTALVYPGMCLLEGTNMSEGRGTDTPFLLFGAPWLNNEKVVSELTALNLAGISFHCENFTPKDIPGKAYNPKLENQLCKGIKLTITNRDKDRPIETTALILQTIAAEHPADFQWNERWINLLSGNRNVRKFIDERKVESLFETWQQNCDRFKKETQKYLLYQ
jgi:uncharacterized protein YbbC (DUF1343 family)